MKPAQWETRRSKLLLFMGACFFLPGVAMLLMSLLPSLIDLQRTASWPSTPGTLLSASLHTQRSNDGNSNVHLAQARYQYTVNGRQYTNDRVAIEDGHDNIGSFQRDLGGKLRRDHSSNRTVPVYYDPSQPQQSLLNRDFRLELFVTKLIFATVFTLVGGALLVWGWKGNRVNTAADLENEPWSANAEWQGQPIYSGAKVTLIILLIITVIWNAIAWASIAFKGPEWLEKREPMGLLLVAMALIGLFIIYKLVKMSAEWRRFGKTPLTLDPFPAQIGGVAKGYISLNRMLPVNSAAKVTLIAMSKRRGGKNTTVTPVWQRTREAIVEVSANGCRLRFDIPVEKDLHSSDTIATEYERNERGLYTQHYWQLRVQHADSGLDRVFSIPVFNVASDQLQQSQNNESRYAASSASVSSVDSHWFGLPDVQQPAPADALPSGLPPGGKSLQMHFPLSHGCGMNLALMLIGLVFFGAGMLAGNGMGGFFGWAFASLFLLIGGVIALAGVCELITTKTVLFDSRTVHVTTGFMGVAIRRRELDYADIKSFKTVRNGSSSSGSGQHKIYYKVSAEIEQGKDLKLVRMMEGDEAANGLVDYLNELIAA